MQSLKKFFQISVKHFVTEIFTEQQNEKNATQHLRELTDDVTVKCLIKMSMTNTTKMSVSLFDQ